MIIKTFLSLIMILTLSWLCKRPTMDVRKIRNLKSGTTSTMHMFRVQIWYESRLALYTIFKGFVEWFFLIISVSQLICFLRRSVIFVEMPRQWYTNVYNFHTFLTSHSNNLHKPSIVLFYWTSTLHTRALEYCYFSR